MQPRCFLIHHAGTETMLTHENQETYSVLLADDDPISRRLFEKILKKEGFNVTCASDGHQALELFRHHFFPLVLTDWEMPVLDGPELCRAIRRESPERYVFIIMLTSKSSKDDLISGLSAGADDYLTKPAHHAELVARLKTGIRILNLEKSLKDAMTEIQVMSITDPLTGIYNRGYINQRLPEEILRSRRYCRDFSMILCDIDHFKKVNDTYGHLAGDTVLQCFAGTLSGTIRQQVDWVGRYGGEEFLIIAPETPLPNAICMAERLRKCIATQTILICDESICITASFGVTGFLSGNIPDSITPEALLQTADSLLYKAKKNGRNQVQSQVFSV